MVRNGAIMLEPRLDCAALARTRADPKSQQRSLCHCRSAQFERPEDGPRDWRGRVSEWTRMGGLEGRRGEARKPEKVRRGSGWG
eukprot:1948333-Pleurochrysis_carterae.AAC.1